MHPSGAKKTAVFLFQDSVFGMFLASKKLKNGVTNEDGKANVSLTKLLT